MKVEKPDLKLGADGDFASRAKATMSALGKKERLAGFAEVELGYDEAVARQEAERCLRCELRLRLSQPMLPPVKVKAA